METSQHDDSRLFVDIVVDITVVVVGGGGIDVVDQGLPDVRHHAVVRAEQGAVLRQQGGGAHPGVGLGRRVGDRVGL